MSEDPLYQYDSGDIINIYSQPDISVPCLPKLVQSEDLIRKGKPFGRYMYDGKLVPRVTAILNYCTGDNEGLMKYAARLGYNYQKESKRTLDIGTNVHAAIAEYLTHGTIECVRDLDEGQDEVYQSLSNFMNWYNHVTKDLGWKVEIYLSESPLICPWCAGTMDSILTINDRRYIVDFKTSKKLSVSYFIQVCAYLWMVENYYQEYMPIAGVGLLRIDKYKDYSFQDLFLDISDPYDNAYIRSCQSTFGIALRMFYSMNILENEFLVVSDEDKQNKTKSNMSNTIIKDKKDISKKRRKR